MQATCLVNKCSVRMKAREVEENEKERKQEIWRVIMIILKMNEIRVRWTITLLFIHYLWTLWGDEHETYRASKGF